MKASEIGRVVLGVTLLGLSVASAAAQRGYLRLRTRAPSAEMGSVGSVGGFRTYGGPRASGRPSGVSRAPRGYSGAGFGTGVLGGARLPAAVTRSRTGMFSPSAAMAYSTPTYRTADPGFLKRVSGYERSMSYWNPLGQTQWNAIPKLSAPLYATEDASRSGFHDYFGLMRAGADERASASAPVDSMADGMRAQTARRIATFSTRAEALFREATASEEEEGRDEKLARVIDLCQAVVAVDKEAHLPFVLMLHAALERDQLLVASRALFGAVLRHPEVFVERPNLARYFEDPEQLDERERIRAAVNRLEEQMRDYLRVGDEHPGYVQLYTVQAYCAWVLEDSARVTHALERAEELSRGEPESVYIRPVKAALEAALQ